MAATDPAAPGSTPSPGVDPGAASRRARPDWRILALLILVAALVWGLDQLAKLLVVQFLPPGEPVPVIGELLQFRFVRNSGAAFSLASGFTWMFSIVATGTVAIIAILAPRIRSRAWAALFGLILGGALGNLTDRLFREPGFGVGHVVDFIQLIYFPAIFNLADIAITTSMVLFVVLSFRGVGFDGRRRLAGPTTDSKGESPDGNP